MLGCFVVTWSSMMILYYYIGGLNQRMNDLSHHVKKLRKDLIGDDGKDEDKD